MTLLENKVQPKKSHIKGLHTCASAGSPRHLETSKYCSTLPSPRQNEQEKETVLLEHSGISSHEGRLFDSAEVTEGHSHPRNIPETSLLHHVISSGYLP